MSNNDLTLAALEAATAARRLTYAVTVPPMWLSLAVFTIAPAGLVWLLWMLYA